MNAPAAPPQTATAEGVLGGGGTRNEATEAAQADREGTTDYFALFPTPPPFNDAASDAGAQTNGATNTTPAIFGTAHPSVDLAVEATAPALDMCPEAATTTNVPVGTVLSVDDAREVYQGKHLCATDPLDDRPSFRKRSWPGSPNQEDLRRGSRRPRLAPLQSEPSSASNPWRSTSRGGGLVWDDLRRDEGSLFEPVAASTPPPRTVQNIDNRTQYGHQSAPRIAARHPSNAHPGSAARPTGNGRETIPGSSSPETDEATRPPRAMDVDPMPSGRDSPAEEAQKKNKGKNRARTQDLESSDADDEPRAPEQGQWDVAELAEARQRSLRQTLMDRAGYRTEENGQGQTEAGPSRLNGGAGRARYTARSVLQAGGRDAHSSYAPPRDSEEGRYADRTPRTDGRPRWTAPGSLRAASAFQPLPNTRAAEYLADADQRERFRTPPLTQRPRAATRYTHNPVSQGEPHHAEQRNSRNLQGDDDWMLSEVAHREWRDEDDEREGSPEHGPDAWPEDGEIIPSALRADVLLDDDSPTAPPADGFPRVHRDDPETATRGMATEWIREIWADPPNSDVLLEVFNYRYTEDDEHTRRIADSLRWAFEQITGEHEFDVVPPEPAEGSSRRARDRPTLWAIRGLSARSVTRAIARGVWSFRAISFLTFPRAITLPSWLFMLEGYLVGDISKIKAAVLRVFREDEMWAWIAEMTTTNPDFAGIPTEEAVERVLGSIRVETFQLTNGNYIANIHVGRSPTRSMREWRRWVAALRARRYPSFAIGTGRVRYIAPCSGCKSVNHLTHLCPYPRTRGWNGPAPSEGVFGERRRDDEENDPNAAFERRTPATQRGNDDRRSGRTRDGSRNGWQQGPPRRGRAPSNAGASNHVNRNPNSAQSSNRRGGPSTRGKKGQDRGYEGRRRF